MKFFKNNKFIILFYLIITFVLINNWFSEGKMLAKAEEKIPLYNIQKTIYLSDYNWYEQGMGVPNISGKTAVPTLKFIHILDQIGLSTLNIQKFLFAFILFSTFLSVFLLSKEIFKQYRRSSFIALSASFFYVFNPFTGINVWYRFLYAFFFFLPLLPWALYFFIKGINDKKLGYSFFFALVIFVFSYAFHSPALLITITIPIGIYFIYSLLSNNKERGFILLYLLFCIVLTFGMNHAWLLSLLKLPSSTSGLVQENTSMITLLALSPYYSLSYIVRLYSKDSIQNLSEINMFFSWIPTVLVISAAWLYRKKREVQYILLILLASLFIAKGASPPFGNVFLFLFNNVTPIQLLRNTFEKVGLLIVLSYSLLVGLSLSQLPKKIMIVSILCLFYPATNILTGKIFHTHDVSISTEVPSYYCELNQYIAGKVSNYRIIQFPVVYSDGTIMKWINPYHGAEPSEMLYKPQVISRISSNQYYKNIYIGFLSTIPYEPISKYTGLFSAKYIVVNADIDYKKLGLGAPDFYRGYLENYHVPSEQKIAICTSIDNLEDRSICHVDEKYSDFSEYYFLKLDFNQLNSSKIKVNIYDINEKIFDWEVDDDNLVRIKSPILNFTYPNIRKVDNIVVRNNSLKNIYADKGTLIKQEGVNFVRQFGNLYLYELDSQQLTPIIYSPAKIEKVNSSEEMFDKMQSSEKKIGDVAYISKNFDTEVSQVNMSFEKISPDKYIVDIKDATKPYIIVLNNIYHEGWKAYIEGEELGEHILINNSVNGYLVAKSGSYEIELIFN